MKTNILSLLFTLGFLLFSLNLSAQEQDIKAMKQQSHVVKLNGDLMSKKIALEKEKNRNAKFLDEAESLNRKSDRKTNKFSPSDPKSTAKDAKNAAKLLRQTESANNDLRKSNLKIKKLEKDILKLEEKLQKLEYSVKIKEN